MWDLPGPGLEPVSPALAGRFLTTAPPGKSHFAHFWIGLFLLLSYRSSLYILDINPLPDIWFANIIPYSVRYFFILFVVSFDAQKFLILLTSNLSLYSFVACAFGVILKPLSNPKSWRFSPTFSSKSFIASALKFRALTHSELIFVYGIKERSNFILLPVGYPVFPAPFLEKMVLSPLNDLGTPVEN